LSLSTLETAKVQGTCRRCLEGLWHRATDTHTAGL